MIALVMVVMMTAGFLPVMNSAVTAEKVFAAASYDRSKALEYAANHWNDGNGLCAEFVSNCINAGGISKSKAWSKGCTTLHGQLMASGLGCEYEITLKSDKSIKASDYEGKLEPGDIILFYCPGCVYIDGCPYIHAVLYAGMDSEGYARCYSHNNANNASKRYYYSKRCYSCKTELKKAYVFHFNTESSKKSVNPDKCLIGTCDGVRYYIPKTYDPYAFESDTGKTSAKIAADSAYSLYTGTIFRNTKTTSTGSCYWLSTDNSHIFQIGYSNASAQKRLRVIYDLMVGEGCPVILRLGDEPGISLVVVGVRVDADVNNLTFDDLLVYYPYSFILCSLSYMKNTPHWYSGNIETGWSLIAPYTGKVFDGFKVK